MTNAQPYAILAVDDDALALNLVERVFADDPDIRTTLTTSPREALELARAGQFDLILADQRMGDMTGLELLAQFRALQPDTIRILLTAYPDLHVALQSINEGLVYRFVLKPWNVDDMRITVRRAIEARRVAQENERLSLQLRQQFDELVDSERMAVVGRLAAGLGHELANAVTPLVAHLKLLDMRFELLTAHAGTAGDPLAAQVRHSIEAMRSAGKQVMAIVSGLKGYAHKSPDPAPWDPNEGVRTAVQLLAHRIRQSRVKLDTDLGPVPAILCRGNEIVQVLLNLIGNAVDEVAEARRGTVRVTTRLAGKDRVRVEVKDTGRGLAERVQQNLFQPFISTKPAGIGTGLGLSICKTIIEAHAGTIAMETAAGEGTTFTVTLPIEAPPPPKREE